MRHADFIIARVLDYGDEKDLKRLRSIYSDDFLRSSPVKGVDIDLKRSKELPREIET